MCSILASTTKSMETEEQKLCDGTHIASSDLPRVVKRLLRSAWRPGDKPSSDSATNRSTIGLDLPLPNSVADEAPTFVRGAQSRSNRKLGYNEAHSCAETGSFRSCRGESTAALPRKLFVQAVGPTAVPNGRPN
jgi:hypothetical protein